MYFMTNSMSFSGEALTRVLVCLLDGKVVRIIALQDQALPVHENSKERIY